MAILRERQTWTAERSGRHPGDLTLAERANVRLALRALRLRVGSFAKLAALMGVTKATLVHAAGTKGRPSAGVALRAARVAYAPVEDLLAGRWPKPGACPTCGRRGLGLASGIWVGVK